MKIIPKRTMFLDGRRVVAGKVEDVSKSEGDLAIRHGWAVEAKAQAEANAKAKAAAEAEAKAKAEAEAAAEAEDKLKNQESNDK